MEMDFSYLPKLNLNSPRYCIGETKVPSKLGSDESMGSTTWSIRTAATIKVTSFWCVFSEEIGYEE